MPGLSYVCGAAEISLRMVVGPTGTAQHNAAAVRPDEAPNRLFAVLNRPLDKVALTPELGAQRQEQKDEVDEEEEEEDEEAEDVQ